MTNGIIIRNGVKYAGGSSSSSSDVKVVDIVEKGNKNAVSSNAVANVVESIADTIINDATSSSATTYSSDKIDSKLMAVAPISDGQFTITDCNDMYDATQTTNYVVNSNVANLPFSNASSLYQIVTVPSVNISSMDSCVQLCYSYNVITYNRAETFAMRSLFNGAWTAWKIFESIKQLTENEYNALTTAEKNNGTIYYISDGNSDYQQSEKPILSGKTCYTFGDSITWYDGNEYNWGKEQGQTCVGYQSYMRSALGLTVTNYGLSGNTMPQICTTGILTKSFAGVDFVTITSGANDERYNIPIGTLATASDPTEMPDYASLDTTTFIGAFQKSIQKILTDNPACKIILMTPIQGWIYGPDGWGDGNPRQDNGIIESKYAEAIKTVGAFYALPVCDWYTNSGISIMTRINYMNDPEPPNNNYYSLHPTKAGYKRMAEQLLPYFRAMAI